MGAGVPFNLCHACERPLEACWAFRIDDRYCSFCGDEITVLRVEQTVPPENRTIWLYTNGSDPLQIHVSMLRGRTQGAMRRMPALVDWKHSDANFNDPRMGHLTFRFRKISAVKGKPDITIVQLECDREFDAQRISPNGIPGELRFACVSGFERRRALLLPRISPPLQYRSCDTNLILNESTWQFHPRDGKVVLSIEVMSSIPLWILNATPSGELPPDTDVAITGLEYPLRLESDTPVPFQIHVQSRDGTMIRRMPLALTWKLASLGRVQVIKDLTVTQSRRLEVGDVNPQRLELKLGQQSDIAFPLTASDGDPSTDAYITIKDFEVWRRPDIGDWLQVTAPLKANLPLIVLPRSDTQPPSQVFLHIDTSRLDRQSFDNKVLEGGVRLFDQLRRQWECALRLTTHRAPPLDGTIGLDWGTTNSCAAFRAGDKTESVRFEKQQQQLERFPSDIYFEDISDPDQPVIWIGSRAVHLAEVHPECCLRSVKRKFQARDDVFVMDEKGRQHTYPLRRVVTLLLHRLVSQAEMHLGREIHHLGLTFPTKWTTTVRHKLEAVTQDLASLLQRDRKGFSVEVTAPQIDEANAVAIQLLTLENLDGRSLPADRFILVAYDFGGGTIDTSVLEVTFDTSSSQPCTRYIGIGGWNNFGGDEVTRAVMKLLHSRLTDALESRQLGREIPLVADGEPVVDAIEGAAERYRVGRKNWDGLWRIAELIKIDLCDSNTANSDPVSERIKPRLSEINCWLSELGAGELAAPVRRLDQVLDKLKAADVDAFYKELRFSLPDVYQFPLDDVDYTNEGRQFNVRERVEDTIRQLRTQCDEAKVEPDIIVLAGGACRLPLVLELIREMIPPRRQNNIIFNPDFAKQRVAHGMASYLFLLDSGDFGSRLVRSVDALHRHLGFQKLERTPEGQFRPVFQPIVRLGTVFDALRWHPFVFNAVQVKRTSKGRRLTLFVRGWREGYRDKPIGYFDLDSPLESPIVGEAIECAAMPEGLAGECRAELLLANSAGLQMRIRDGDRWLGLFPLVPTVPNLEAELQG